MHICTVIADNYFMLLQSFISRSNVRLFKKAGAATKGLLAFSSFNRQQDITTIASFASPLSDFMSPTSQELKNSYHPKQKLDSSDVTFSSAVSNFIASRPYEIISDNLLHPRPTSISPYPPFTSPISYASPFADFSGPRYEEEISQRIEEEYKTNMSFATPFADVIAPLPQNNSENALLISESDRSFEPYNTLVSFSSPESDFTFRAHSEDHEDVFQASRKISFSTPFADVCAPSLFEQSQPSEIVIQTNLSFSSPESDICGSDISKLMLKSAPTDLSFSSPEADFVSAPIVRVPQPLASIPRNTYEDMESDAAAFLSIPRTLSAALLPSPQARVITELNPPFRITHVNEAWEGLCGFSRDEAVGRTLEMLQGPGTVTEDLERINARVLRQELVSMTLINYRKNGKAFVNHLRVVPLTTTPGSDTVTHMMGVLEDVTRSYASNEL